MRYRELGKSKIKVSEIGFGTWGIGGTHNGATAYGPTDDAESKRTLLRALERGVTFYETSDLYGYGHSEELLGETFSTQRNNVVIASKVGFLDFGGKQSFAPDHVRDALSKSLGRLKTDYLDLYMLHSPTTEELRSNLEIFETFRALKKEGKIRSYGAAVRSPEDGLLVLENFPDVDCIQVNFNFVDQRALGNGLFEKAKKNGVGIIVRTPLCFGFLTGKYTANDTFDALDHRSKWSKAQIEKWHQASHTFTEELAKREGQTSSQIALRFCLSFEGVSTLIPGMLNVEHVEENAKSSDFGVIANGEIAKFIEIYKGQEFFVKNG